MFQLLFLIVSVHPIALVEANANITCTSLDSDVLKYNSPSGNCTELLEEFAQACGDFVSCALRHSKPMCYCGACEDNYTALNTVYDNILKFSRNSSDLDPYCTDTLLRSDEIATITTSYEFVRSLWLEEGNCQFCTRHFYNEDVKNFYELLNSTLDCWSQFVDLSDPDWRVEGYDGPVPPVDPAICTVCADSYHQLVHHYDHYIDRMEGKDRSLCQDILQHMNMTTLQWGQHFKCDKPKIDFSVFGPVAAVLLCIPLLFYGGLNLLGRVQEKREEKWHRRDEASGANSPKSPSTPKSTNTSRVN